MATESGEFLDALETDDDERQMYTKIVKFNLQQNH